MKKARKVHSLLSEPETENKRPDVQERLQDQEKPHTTVHNKNTKNVCYTFKFL